jgi:uncharacterized RDD family membrane protein YckC
MTDVNPYAAPKAAVEDVKPAAGELASLWERFAAAFVDFLCFGLAGMIGGIVFGFATASGGSVSGPIAVMTVPILLMSLINLWMLHRYRASVGKRALGIRIVRSDGSESGLARILFMRGLPQWLIAAAGNVVPPVHLLTLADVAFVFGRTRQCVHDRIADTIVVKAG